MKRGNRRSCTSRNENSQNKYVFSKGRGREKKRVASSTQCFPKRDGGTGGTRVQGGYLADVAPSGFII